MFKYALATFIIAGTFQLHAATLHTPYTVEVMAINGHKVDTKVHQQTLHKGNNQVVLKYTDSLKDGSKNKRFSTKPLITNIQVDDEIQDIAIHHKRFYSYSEAVSAYKNNQFNWRMTLNDKTRPLTMMILPSNQGFMPYQNIEKIIKNYNRKHHILLTEPHTKKPHGPLIQHFKAWYLNATPAEKKTLLKWMIDHSNNEQ